jgi:flagellar motility protein MotE (MotC chaperone)
MSGAKSRNRRVRSGTLFIISILLVGSATLRIGVQASTNLKRNLPEGVEQIDQAEQVETTPADLQQLLSVLRSQEQQLNRREILLEDKAKALEIADEAIDRKLAELIESEERLSTTLAMADGASEGDLSRLTDVYEKMKPKDSAALFEEMAPEFAAGFLARMRPVAAANVMAGLSPKTAYAVSVILAGRNAWVPKE